MLELDKLILFTFCLLLFSPLGAQALPTVDINSNSTTEGVLGSLVFLIDTPQYRLDIPPNTLSLSIQLIPNDNNADLGFAVRFARLVEYDPFSDIIFADFTADVLAIGTESILISEPVSGQWYIALANFEETNQGFQLVVSAIIDEPSPTPTATHTSAPPTITPTATSTATPTLQPPTVTPTSTRTPRSGPTVINELADVMQDGYVDGDDLWVLQQNWFRGNTGARELSLPTKSFPNLKQGDRVWSPGTYKPEPGADFTVTLRVSSSDGIAGGQCTLQYDATILEAQKAGTDTPTSGFSIQSNPTTGEIRIAFANASGAAPGTDLGLVALPMKVKAAVQHGQTTELTLLEASFFDENAQQISLKAENGSVEIQSSGVILNERTDINQDGAVNELDMVEFYQNWHHVNPQ